MIFRKKNKNFFWKYIDLDFRDYMFNTDLKVLKHTSRMYRFFNKIKHDNNLIRIKYAENLFHHLVMSRRTESILSTRLDRIIYCGEFDSL